MEFSTAHDGGLPAVRETKGPQILADAERERQVAHHLMEISAQDPFNFLR
jgi:hypothetical protein